MEGFKIFITAPFKERKNKEEIEHLCGLVREAGFEDFCFIRDIEKYSKIFNNPKELMRRAKEEIKKCDALLIDFSSKSTGRTLETGIAFALGMEIIVIKKEGVNLKDTAKGMADKIVEYKKINNIKNP